MMNRESQIIEFISNNGSATIEEVAIHYTGESRQNLYTSKMQALENKGLVKKTEETRKTTNNGTATVYDLVENKIPSSLDKFKADDHEVFLYTVSPTQAMQIRDHLFNSGNRDIRSKGVKEYSQEMESGFFYPCSSLVFSKSGMLMDGHHRITSQIQANAYITYVVQVGGDEEWNVILGNAVKRDTKDAIKMTAHKFESINLDKKQQALFSTVVTHMLANKDRTENIRITGSKTSNNKIVEDYMGDNYEFLMGFYELHKQLLDETDYSYYVSGRGTNKLKRGIITACADIYNADPAFARKYLFSVFGRYSEGVLGGTTPSSVKAIINKALRMRNEGTEGKICEIMVYSCLSHGFIIIKDSLSKGSLTVESNSKYNLKPNSTLLVKTEKKFVVDVKRPV